MRVCLNWSKLVIIIMALVHLGCQSQVEAPGPKETSSLDASCYWPAPNAADSAIVADGTFTMVSDADWTEDAVRRVLQVFAFGGFATDAQIKTWADMNPGAAIVEILTLDPINEKVSPPESFDDLGQINSTLGCMSTLWSQPNKHNKMWPTRRSDFALSSWNSPQKIWIHLSSKRGTNLVRQRLGLWATNYHMAVNEDAGVNFHQSVQYYDDIMNDLAARKPFAEVLTNAALSATVATQYGHRENRYRDGKFSGNDDFAREYFQLFFGILGTSSTYTSTYHETVTIPNMARALTDIRVPYVIFGPDDEGYSVTSTINSQYHYPGDLEILKTTNTGSNARERLQLLSSTSIANEESLANLPVRIIQNLADDTMDDARKTEVRAIWAGLANKELLTFLRKYAISTTFHNSERVKYWTSIERNMMHTNLATNSNFESYQQFYYPEWRMEAEDIQIFRPNHNVFGHQTGIEASSSSDPFQLTYERSLNEYWFYSRANDTATGWKKDWASIIPANAQGQYNVSDVTEWLWHRYIADDLTQLGYLERYHIESLLSTGKDLGLALSTTDPERVFTESELATAHSSPSSTLGQSLLAIRQSQVEISSTDTNVRLTANYKIGLAINFILSTPYAFAQTGK